MERNLIQVKDKEKAKVLRELLQVLDFVEFVNTPTETTPTHSTEADSEDFFSLAGLWEGREISLALIRQQAWPRQTYGSV